MPQSLNGFSYVEGNPVNYTDPSGRCIDPVSGTLCLGAAIGTTLVVGGALLIAGYTIPQQMEDTQAILETFPAISPSDLWNWQTAPHGPDLQCLDEGYWPTGGINTQPWSTLPFPMTPPYFGPLPGFPTSIGVPIPNTSYADSRPSSEIRKSIRSFEKEIAKHQRKIDQRIGFDPVSSDPVINQRAAEARLRHLQHEIEVYRTQIEALRQELIKRGETP